MTLIFRYLLTAMDTLKEAFKQRQKWSEVLSILINRRDIIQTVFVFAIKSFILSKKLVLSYITTYKNQHKLITFDQSIFCLHKKLPLSSAKYP